MKSALWRTCIGSFITAVFCLAICTLSFGAEGKSIGEMEKELNALKASIASLTEQMEAVRQKQEAVVPSFVARKDDDEDDEDDLIMLKEEVRILKKEVRTAAQAEPTLRAEDVTGNVFSEFARKVKLGGQIRTRAEYANGFYNVPDASLPGANSSLPTGGPRGDRPRTSIDDEYVLHQTRLWADADVNEHLRVFIQLQDSRAWGVAGTTVGFAVDRDGRSTLGLHQGYFDVRRLFDLPLTARVGRQEIIWGDHRLIGNFVWSNMGRTFDGARFMWETDAIHAEAFGAIVRETGFDTGIGTEGDGDESVYAARFGLKKLIPGALLELMYIQKNQHDRTSNSAITTGFAAAGDGKVLIHNIGARIDGKLPNLEAVDYTFEAHGQFGDYGDLTHRAYAFAGRAGYTFRDVAWTPRFGLEYSFASGDKDPDDSHHGTFDNLYPTNHWQGNYGFIDLVSWQNVHNARANIKVVPTAKLTAQVDYHYFWLNHSADGWYFANGNPAAVRPAGGFTETSNRLAQEVDLTLSYDLYRNVKLLAGYSYFDPQTWIKSELGDIPTQWGFIQATVTF
jgi:hypothetical protein